MGHQILEVNVVELCLLVVGVSVVIWVMLIQRKHVRYLVRFIETLDELTEEVARLKARNAEWELEDEPEHFS